MYLNQISRAKEHAMVNTTPENGLKSQSQFDLNFGKSLVAQPGTEDMYRCIQCGTCSSSCPMVALMEQTPRKIIAMARAGLKNDVLASNTLWLCSSCYSCTVACPKQIRITDVMYSLKRRSTQLPSNVARPANVLARAFIASVAKTGRSNESRTILKTWLKTNPLELLRQAWLGLRLWLRGRLSFAEHRMTGKPRDLQRLLVEVGQTHSSPMKG